MPVAVQLCDKDFLPRDVGSSLCDVSPSIDSRSSVRLCPIVATICLPAQHSERTGGALSPVGCCLLAIVGQDLFVFPSASRNSSSPGLAKAASPRKLSRFSRRPATRQTDNSATSSTLDCNSLKSSLAQAADDVIDGGLVGEQASQIAFDKGEVGIELLQLGQRRLRLPEPAEARRDRQRHNAARPASCD